jgi:hypothetical protein
MAFALGNKPLPGYPQQVGEKIEIVFDHTGPTSYTQFSSTTGLGGDVFQAATSGLNIGGFDFVEISRDSTGQVGAAVALVNSGTGNSVKSFTIIYTALATATIGGQSQTINTQIVAATNLSTLSWRVRALCV